MDSYFENQAKEIFSEIKNSTLSDVEILEKLKRKLQNIVLDVEHDSSIRTEAWELSYHD